MAGNDAFPARHVDFSTALLLGIALDFGRVVPDALHAGHSTHATIAVQRAGHAGDRRCLEIRHASARLILRRNAIQQTQLLRLLLHIALAELRALCVSPETPAPQAAVLAGAEKPLSGIVGAVGAEGKEAQARHSCSMSAARVERSGHGRERSLVEDPGLKGVVQAARHDDGLASQEFDPADAASNAAGGLGRRLVGAPQNTHFATSAIQIPESDIAVVAASGRHDAFLGTIVAGSDAVGPEGDGSDRKIRRSANVQPQDLLIRANIVDHDRAGFVSDCEERKDRCRLQSRDCAEARSGREECVQELSGAQVPDLDGSILAAGENLVQVGGHGADATGERAGRGADEARVVLQGRGLPHLDAAGTGAHNPFTKGDDLGDVLTEAAGHLELADLLTALEQPYPARSLGALSAPCSNNDLLPCERCGDVLGRLGAGDEDKTEALL